MKNRKEGLLWTRWLARQKRLRNKVVLIDAVKDASWTGQTLTDIAGAFADYLLRFEPAERIAFRLPNGAEWLALFLATQRAGLAAIPLDGGMPKEGCLETARRLGARALYLDGEFHALAKVAPKIKRDTKCGCIKITSGTGALPKSIECRAEHLLADGENVSKTMGIRPSDLNLAVIPLGHSYGLGNLVMPLILQGTAMVCAGEYMPRQLIEWIERYRITVFPTVPALLRVLAALPPKVAVAGPRDGSTPTAATASLFGSLRTVISAGAVLTPSVAQAFFERYGRKVHNFYGSSETGGICYDRTGNASLSGRSVGKPLAGVSVAVKVGRITVKSRAVATPSRSWRLNDFGEWNPRGELVLLGRVGNEANIGGKKVHPLEVERLLRALPGVTDVVVWSWQSQGRDLLAAGVETMRSRSEIERELAAHLSAWKLPKAWVVTRELPRTARGKIDLAALKEQV